MPEASLQSVARLDDPGFYAAEPYDVYARLRSEAPIFWYEAGQFWALSRYDDVRRVARDAELFSSEYGLRPPESIPTDDGSEIDVETMPRRAELRSRQSLSNLLGGDLIVGTDPPRHTTLRRLVSYAFTPKVVNTLERDVHELTVAALDAIEPGTVADLVETLALPVPMYVTAKMLGVAREDWPAFRRWADAIIEATDFSTDRHSEKVAYWMEQFGELVAYFTSALAERRDKPRDDLLTALVQPTADGEQLSEANQLSMVIVLLTGGIETTRSLIANGAKLLAEHPDQRALLLERPDLMPTAVDECLRFGTPVVSMARTATAAAEIRGQPIERGDYVVMLFAAANRDEDTWDDAEAFWVERPSDPMHLAFGFGPHFCLGATIARCEGRIMFGELLERFPRFELAGGVERLASTLAPAIHSMPVLFQ